MQVIRDFIFKNNISETSFAFGVSGGADSLALVLMFKEAFPDFHLVALTVDHRLRPTSADEALYVADVMKRFGIEHHILVWEDEKPICGIEEKAREARYQLLCSWCMENNFNNLVIAHHLYDQAETFLMRLQRGSGLYGLSAMNEISYKKNIKVLRPLLTTPPEQLKEYLKKRNIDWIEDESNQCTDFLRVKMRKFLPTLFNETGISAERISLATQNLQRCKNFLEDMTNTIIENKIHNWDNICYSFDVTEFLTWHEELQFNIVGKLINKLNTSKYRPEADSLSTLINDMKQDLFDSATLGKCLIIKNDLRFWFMLENRGIDLSYSENEWEKYLLENPSVRGIKIPHKFKELLLNKKILKKI